MTLSGSAVTGCSSTPIVQPLRPAGIGAAAPATAATAATGGTTLPQFLGITNLFRGGFGLIRLARDRITARLGSRFPGLEPRPPLKLLTDPANMSEDAPPSVQAAAKIKAEQDAGAQKAKAAAYLATVGCGCYEGVAEALAENLKDCNEEVRYATVKALRDLGVRSCSCCGGNSCCTVEVHRELMRLAWELDYHGCYVERSQRVRRLARLALETCCEPFAGSTEDTIPEEGPGPDAGQVIGGEAAAPAPAGGEATADSGAPPTTAWRQTRQSPQPLGQRSRPSGTVMPVTATRLGQRGPAEQAHSDRGEHSEWGERSHTGPGPILALVNGEPIRASDLAPDYGTPTKAAPGVGLGERASFRPERLTEAIDRRLLAQAARESLPLEVRSRIEWQILSEAEDRGAGGDLQDRPRRLEVALGREWLRRQIDSETRPVAASAGLDYSPASEVACLERLRSRATILVQPDSRYP
ncbi:MAG: hypothetical protein EA381_14650 [Planctomycetaceae bacterium]|nr:MAG: hypothetical protein EA381_14650 [Planctomycetaceae bacterium]